MCLYKKVQSYVVQIFLHRSNVYLCVFLLFFNSGYIISKNEKGFTRMSKKLRLLAVFALAITALFLLPAVSFAAPRTVEQTANKVTTVSLAFTAAVPNTTVALTGGLKLGIRKSGSFDGTFTQADGTKLGVGGKLQSTGDFNITFYNKQGGAYIFGVGKPNAAGVFVGTFQIRNGASGIWSAVVVPNPAAVLALAFTGKSGAVFLAGAIVLDGKTLQGTFSLANGAVLPVSATLIKNSYYQIRVSFANGAIVGYGKSTATGFAGPFTITASGAKGKWVANVFGF